MMRSLLTLALLLTPTIAMSQPTLPTPPAPPAALSLFAKLVGEWEGEASAVMGPGARHILRQTERVEAVAGATAFAVRGRGFEKIADGREQMTFDAFAVIYLDHDHVTPRMRTFTMQGGNWTDPDFSLSADGYRWSMRDPRAGLIRYDMKFDKEGCWIETGAVSRDDGATWSPIFEMKLRRVSDHR